MNATISINLIHIGNNVSPNLIWQRYILQFYRLVPVLRCSVRDPVRRDAWVMVKVMGVNVE